MLAAVSGGSDSVALAWLLWDLARDGDLVLAGLAHLNHGIRGADADGDEAFTADLARRLGVEFARAAVDVPALAAARRVSLEVAGRDERRRFLAGAAARLGASRVATAHTRDDQAETVMLRVLRGAGLRGLAGIPPVRGVFVRPLLDCTRDALQGWLRARGESWREDVTNREPGTPRNRLRLEVLPSLRGAFNPALDAALARLADIVGVEDQYLEEQTARLLPDVVEVADSGVRVDLAALAQLPEALARRVARRALETADPGRTYGIEEADALRAAAAGPGRIGSVGRLRMERNGSVVVLTDRASAARPAEAFSYPLTVPGVCPVPEAGVTVEACTPRPAGPRLDPPGADEVQVDASAVGTRLVVRSRRPGDRIRPLGLGGRKKLQDLFVDRKVPCIERDRVPILVDARGRIVWVAGHVLGEEFRVTRDTNAVVALKLRRF
ncbi:MAG: tRNA lysidine(34) synthetase TilS [Acidobacteriota bacterium]